RPCDDARMGRRLATGMLLAVLPMAGGCLRCPDVLSASVDVTVTNETADTVVSSTQDGSASTRATLGADGDGGRVWWVSGGPGHFVVTATSGTRTATTTVDVVALDMCLTRTEHATLTLPP